MCHFCSCGMSSVPADVAHTNLSLHRKSVGCVHVFLVHNIALFCKRWFGGAQQFTPRPVQWSGTIRKYLSMASQNLALYSSGETTVGIFP